jgi:hypothetical protein
MKECLPGGWLPSTSIGLEDSTDSSSDGVPYPFDTILLVSDWLWLWRDPITCRALVCATFVIHAYREQGEQQETAEQSFYTHARSTRRINQHPGVINKWKRSGGRYRDNDPRWILENKIIWMLLYADLIRENLGEWASPVYAYRG